MLIFPFFLAHLLLPLLGAGAAFHPSLRRFSAGARVAAAFGAGAILLAGEALAFSAVGIRWSIGALALPLLALAALLSVLFSRRPAVPVPFAESSGWVRVAVAIAIALALAHLTLWMTASRGTSPDFSFFWGVKGVRFAVARRLDASLLADPTFSYAVPHYPPLVPILDAWGVLFSGDMPWIRAAILAAIWWLATLPLIRDFLRRVISDDGAAVVTCFWAVAMAISFGYSGSGANAEAPLVFFETVALVSLLTEEKGKSDSRFLGSLALAGATLTKVEGSVAAVLIVLGVVTRDLLERRPRILRRTIPLVAGSTAGVGAWFAFQRLSGLPVGYPPHGKPLVLYPQHLGIILQECFKQLEAGSWWLSWIIPLLFLAAGWRGFRSLLPAVTLAAGLFLAAVWDYLHSPTDPSVVISWTFPRVSQPALSATILAAGLATFSRRSGTRIEAVAST